MSRWLASKASKVLAALMRAGWSVKRTTGSHRVLTRPGWPDYVWAFHPGEEIGPSMLRRIEKKTGLKPEDLQTLRVIPRDARIRVRMRA